MSNNLPLHVAFIVDGNRRWARQRGLPEVAGHKKVVNEVFEKLVEHAVKKGIPYLTFWVFSTENWKRGERFTKFFFALLKRGLEKNARDCARKGYRMKTIGDLTKLPKTLRKMLEDWQEKTKNNRKITITIAINYGGRDEILRAIERAKSRIKNQESRITKEEFEKYLDTAGMPDPDLIIRPGGEHRLSGFLLWQSEYSELYFSEVLFPDFDVAEFEKALQWFASRERRFGK